MPKGKYKRKQIRGKKFKIAPGQVWRNNVGPEEVFTGRPEPEHEAGELTEHAARQPLTDGVATVQVNYGTINFHIYR